MKCKKLHIVPYIVIEDAVTVSSRLHAGFGNIRSLAYCKESTTFKTNSHSSASKHSDLYGSVTRMRWLMLFKRTIDVCSENPYELHVPHRILSWFNYEPYTLRSICWMAEQFSTIQTSHTAPKNYSTPSWTYWIFRFLANVVKIRLNTFTTHNVIKYSRAISGYESDCLWKFSNATV